MFIIILVDNIFYISAAWLTAHSCKQVANSKQGFAFIVAWQLIMSLQFCYHLTPAPREREHGWDSLEACHMVCCGPLCVCSQTHTSNKASHDSSIVPQWQLWTFGDKLYFVCLDEQYPYNTELPPIICSITVRVWLYHYVSTHCFQLMHD